MRNFISEYGTMVVSAIAAVFILTAIISQFMNGGMVADTILKLMNNAF